MKTFITMFAKAVLFLSTLQFYGAAAQADCIDIRGRTVSNGMHFVPGPDTCTLCVCEMGQPKVCKAVLCSPPQDCRSFRVGNTCCEFICLDDVVKQTESERVEANVRMALGGGAAAILATIALIVYRVRRQKRRRNTHADDQRSLTSIGYISGSMAYMSGQCETALGVWKPHGNYLPRGEAPPPYEEVVGQCQMERMATEPPYHRTYPTTLESLSRPDDMLCNGHGYMNIARPVQQMPNTQNCYNAPLLQPVHQAEVQIRDVNQMTHHALAANMAGVGVRARLTGSLGAISGRLSVPREPDHERPHNVPGFYANSHALHSALHRTIPRITTAIEALELGAFRRAEGGFGALNAVPGAGEVRRSFHRPCAPRRDTGRSVPRHLDLASAPLASSLRLVSSTGGRSRAHSEDNVGGEPSPPLLPPGPPISLPPGPPGPGPVGPISLPPGPPGPASIGQPSQTLEPAPAPKPEAPMPAPQNTLPLTVDKPSCVCSYADGSTEEAPPADEHDDYRSECENCKSASSSRWVLEEGWADEGEEGTQTLQRRAPPPPGPPAPATATLPQPVTKQGRNAMGPPSNWENWFNTIPDSDSESEEE